jgi:P-type Ca2+ transporter type 2C
MQPHEQDIPAVLAELTTTVRGLSVTEARTRRGRFGPNELSEKKKKTAFRMFLDQFTDFMILVLIAAAAVSGWLGEISDTIAIVVIVFLNAALGFSQEYRAERAMTALRKMAASSATVLRDGAPAAIPAMELVPGDVVLLEAGNIVPADLRIVEAARLKADEAALTGESVPVDKHAGLLQGGSAALADRRNMLYKGTFITYGRGTAVVTATGMNTELGRIAAMIQAEDDAKTPLQKRLAVFGKMLAYAVLAICAIVYFAGLLRGEAPVAMFLVAVSLAVAAIPEALPAVVTISLALGARKMVKRNALVRKLPAVETLGSVTYICTDKTGTLTINKMTAEELWYDGMSVRNSEFGVRPPMKPEPQHRDPGLFFTALALSNDARMDAEGSVAGDPTEAALLTAAHDQGFAKKRLEDAFPRVAELPFDSDRKLMSTFHRIEADAHSPILTFIGSPVRFISFTKGAVEIVLDRSTRILTSGGVKPLDRDEIIRAGERIAAQGLRVMAVGMRVWREVPADPAAVDAERELTLLGLIGLMDPPREEARDAVAQCRSAGIIPVMITGDHPLTARSIAARVGILTRDDRDAVITGPELEALPPEQFEQRVEAFRVYARVAPEQKLRIVKALQDKGHFVAMTGDGVNDAPALKRADIGVAMGITGTDVSKEASSMILLDDNFATIVRAVKEGRKIYDNIRKFIKYLLTTNSGEIWTLFLAPFAGLPIPLQPIHILWINLVTDGLPALALSLEPAEPTIMQRPPRHPKESIFSGGLGAHAIWVGLLMAGIVLTLQAWAIHIGDRHWQTMVFATLCFLQLGHVMAIRSERRSLFSQGLGSNKALLAAVIGTVLLQLATIYIPVLNPVFRTEPLTNAELFSVLALSSLVFIAVEIEKLIKRCRNKS